MRALFHYFFMREPLIQLPLGMQLSDEATFANYLPGSNQLLLGFLRQRRSLDIVHPESFIYLYGVSGVGCTHLLQAACHEAHGFKQSAIYLPMHEFVYQSPKLLEGVEYLDLICIDDIHVLADHPSWEEAIFYLFNRIKETDKRLLVASHCAPSQLNFCLQDLVSRLISGVVIQVSQLNDLEKYQALRLRAHLRGLNMPHHVARYILHHYSRDMHQLFDILSQLDNASLQTKSRISIALVKKVIHDCAVHTVSVINS